MVGLAQLLRNLGALGADGVGGAKVESAIRFAIWSTSATGDDISTTEAAGAEAAPRKLLKSKLSTSKVIGETARGRGHS